MKVLLLSPYGETVVNATLRAAGDTVVQTAEPLDIRDLEREGADFLVSYGYAHILRPPVLDRFTGRAINLHVSYLPWNRGAHPNLWSIIDDTPKGVTIHALDAGIDTGAILAQRLVNFAPDDTLATSYETLRQAVEALFEETWADLREGRLTAVPQDPTAGSIHRRRDLDAVWPLLPEGWNTRIANVPRRHQLTGR